MQCLLYLNMLLKSTIISEISEYVEKMPQPKQKALLDALRKDAIIQQARKLDKTVKKNNITVDEIVSIIREVRKKRYNAGKQVRS